MSGFLVHIVIGIISGFIVYNFHKKLEFGLIIFIGNILPDVLKITYLSLYHNTLNLTFLAHSNMHLPTHLVVNGRDFVILFGAFFFAIGWLLYHFHFIKKKKLWEFDKLLIYLLVGYLIHLFFDSTYSLLPRHGLLI